jgi:hypothetical protein
MRIVLCLCSVFLGSARADEAADRAAIERVITDLNVARKGKDLKPVSRLFTTDTDASNGLDRLARMDQWMRSLAQKPMSEVTLPHIVPRDIRFVVADVALVDSEIAQYGSMILKQSVPVLLVMKREGTEWRIASVRVMECLHQLQQSPPRQ